MALVPYNSGRASSFPGLFSNSYRRGERYSSDVNYPAHGGGRHSQGDRGFPFTTVRIIGGVLIILAVLVFILGTVAVALNVPMDENDGILLIFGAVSMTVVTAMAATAGALGIFHSEYRSNLEAYRNSFQTLCVLTSVTCIAMMIAESVYIQQVYGDDTLASVNPDFEANSAIFITLAVLTAITALVASLGSFVACCMPGLCTPIVDNNGYVFSYDRRERGFNDAGIMNFLGIGRSYDDGPRVITRPARRYDDFYPSYVTKPRRTRYY